MLRAPTDRPFCALGIDVGGTKIAAGIVDFPGGRVRARRLASTRPERGGRPILADVLRLAQELEIAAPPALPQAIGLALCELVDPHGRIMSQSSLAWDDLAVQAELSPKLPLVIEADVRAAALAEAHFGAGRGAKVFLYVTIGTGISSCLVIEGRPFPGARGAAGTFASSPVGCLCPHCGHPHDRSVEQLASGPGLVSAANQRQPGSFSTAEEILRAAASDHPLASAVIRTGAHAVGNLIGWLVNVLDPELVVVGGGLGLAGGMYWDNLVATARQAIWWDGHRSLPIVPAATGADAALIGAATATWLMVNN